MSRPVSTRLAELSLWEEFLGTVDFFHHGKFYTVRGEFDSAEKTRFQTESGFKGLAQLRSGKLAEIKAELTIIWTGDPQALAKDWRILEIHTKSFRLAETDRPLFVDVLDHALGEADRVRARRSTRDEALIQWVL